MNFFKKYKKKNADVIRRAIPEFKKRISGGGPADMVVNKIEDDINVYISYVMMMNQVKNQNIHDRFVYNILTIFMFITGDQEYIG